MTSSGRSKGTLISIVVSLALMLAVASGTAYGAAALSGGGPQPEDVLPREAIAFVKVDFDPAAGQKLAAYQLARKFPRSGVTGPDTLRDDLLRSVLGVKARADYAAYVKPWIGQRAGVAVLKPLRAKPDEPVLVAAVQVTDKAKAATGLRQLAKRAPKGSDVVHHAFASEHDYVLLSTDKAAVGRAAVQREHLSANPRFSKALTALDGDQIAAGWADVGAAWKALPMSARSGLMGPYAKLSLTGSFVFGAHVADGTVEVVAKTVDLSADGSAAAQRLLDNPLGKATPTGLIKALPGDSMVAASVTGLGDGLAQLYDDSPELKKDKDFRALVKALKLSLPADIKAVFGTEAAFSVAASPPYRSATVTLRVNTPNRARATKVISNGRAYWEKMNGPGAGPVELTASGRPSELSVLDIRATHAGYLASYGPIDTSPSGRSGLQLGDSHVFQRTLPDVDIAGQAFYVDVARVVASLDALLGQGTSSVLTPQQKRAISPIQAAGYTTITAPDGNSTTRFRLTIAR